MRERERERERERGRGREIEREGEMHSVLQMGPQQLIARPVSYGMDIKGPSALAILRPLSRPRWRHRPTASFAFLVRSRT
jgi:hypothetical protein